MEPSSLDKMLAEHFSKSVPANNAAFRLELDLWLLQHKLDPETKFCDLPMWAQSEICQKAAIDLRGPIN